MNELRSDGSTLGADDGQAVAFRANGQLAARHGTAVFCDELGDMRLFVRRQFFDLLHDFKRAHGLMIGPNVFLASCIALRSSTGTREELGESMV